MIWTIDYCVERYAKDTSLMGFACGRRCLQKYEPCIYSVDNDMLSIKGIGCHIDIDFQTNEIIHYLDREIAMEDVRAVTDLYFNEMDNKQIFDGFHVQWNMITAFLIPMIRAKSEMGSKEWVEYLNGYVGSITNNLCSYIKQGKYCYFYHKYSKNDIEVISCEKMIKKYIKETPGSIDKSILLNTEHYGVTLYNALLKNGIIASNKFNMD